MNEVRSKESCRRVSISPSPPSRTSWWATSPRSRTECTGMPSTRRPARAVGVLGGGVRDVAEAGLGAGRRDEAGRAGGGARGRVDLGRVVQLDDLDRLVEPRRLLGEPHHEDRADGEVGGDEDADPGVLGERLTQRRQPRLVPAGGADDDVHALLDAVRARCRATRPGPRTPRRRRPRRGRRGRRPGRTGRPARGPSASVDRPAHLRRPSVPPHRSRPP